VKTPHLLYIKLPTNKKQPTTLPTLYVIVTYDHMLLPCAMSQELPPINNSWRVSPRSSPAIYKTYMNITERPVGQ